MTSPVERSAFCSICPSPEAVTDHLARFGLVLTYARPAEMAQDYLHLPPLPAQYHYEDARGTQVMFLAGPDTSCLADDEGDEEVDLLPGRNSYPPHASRFWLIPGANELTTHHVQEALAARWAFHWYDPRHENATEHAA